MTRRDALWKAGAFGAVAWTVPAIVSSPALAQGSTTGAGCAPATAPSFIRSFAIASNSPDVTTDSAGLLYTTTRSGRIDVWDPTGTSLGSIGVSGGGFGQLSQTEAIDTGPGDLLYVTDTGRDRVVVLTTAGVAVTEFGTSGSGVGQFVFPWGIAVSPAGEVFVADGLSGRNVVLRFSAGGVFQNEWSYTSPEGVAVDSVGNVFVAQGGSNLISRFDASGTLLGSFGTASSTRRMVVDGCDNLIVAHRYANGQVDVYDSTQNLVYSFGAAQLNVSSVNVIGVAVAPDGSIWVANQSGSLFGFG